jgi:phosphate transport system substrate-binding protein
MQREFLKMVLSRQGQEITARDGYVPLPAAVAERTRNELGLE